MCVIVHAGPAHMIQNVLGTKYSGIEYRVIIGI